MHHQEEDANVHHKKHYNNSDYIKLKEHQLYLWSEELRKVIMRIVQSKLGNIWPKHKAYYWFAVTKSRKGLIEKKESSILY